MHVSVHTTNNPANSRPSKRVLGIKVDFLFRAVVRRPFPATFSPRIEMLVMLLREYTISLLLIKNYLFYFTTNIHTCTY